MSERITMSLWEPVQASPVCGVYAIRCIANGKFYIGSSLNVAQRVGKHIALLRRLKHDNRWLQNCFNKYGEEAFACELLEAANAEDIHQVEQRWIDKYWGSGHLLNIQQIAGRPPTFYELTEETRERKRKKHQAPTGRQPTSKMLEKLAQRVGPRNPNFGKKLPAEHVAKMRLALFASDKLWRSGAQSPIFGLQRSPETRKAMSEAQKRRFAEGAGNAKSKPCQRVDPDGAVTVFPSARAASAALGLGTNTVARWCAGLREPQDGCSWGYVNAS